MAVATHTIRAVIHQAVVAMVDCHSYSPQKETQVSYRSYFFTL